MTEQIAAISSGSLPFQADKLASYLSEFLPGRGAVHLSPVSGGLSNPTFFMEFGGARYVLRKKPEGNLLPSAHAIDREYKVIGALAETAVPVPRLLHYCDNPDIIGTDFYVMERLDGRVFHDNGLPGLDPSERGAIFDAMAQTLADLHEVDIAAVGLSDFGKLGGFITRQIKRWSRQYEDGKFRDIPEIPRLADWLRANQPEADTTTIVHGDYRLGNLILHPERPEIIGVLDWELATLGDPMSDIGYNLMSWVMRQEEYHGLGGRDLAALGIPDRDSYAAAYLARRGLTPPLDPYYIAFAFFRLAVIFEGVVGRARQGSRDASEAETLSHYSSVFAKHGLSLAGA
ncbi:MAG: phosphotransferase family protein [Mangrovicoccus sp.]